MNTILNPSRPSSKPSGDRSGGDAASSHYRRHGTALPSWSDLEPKTNRRRQEPDDDGSFLENVSTVRFGLLLLVLAALFTLYVGHVHATQQLLMDVQEARRVNHKLHLKHNRLKGEFDHATGPSVIYDRARELGLRESVPSGRTVIVPE